MSKSTSTTRKPTAQQRLDRLEALLTDFLAAQGVSTEEVTEPVLVGSPDVIEVSPSTGAVLGTATAIKAGNKNLAEFLRSIRVVPQGKAWALAKAGERGQVLLQAANAADDLDFTKYAEVGQKIQANVAARIDGSAPAQTTKSPKKVAAGKKAVKGRARDGKGRLLPRATAPVTALVEASKVDLLITAGFTRDEALRHIASLV